MNRCPDASVWVLYAADELADADRLDLQDHLEECEACRGELASVVRGLAALGRYTCRPALRPQAVEVLRRRLAEKPARQAARPRVLTLASRHRWAAAAAIIACAAAVSLLLVPARQTHQEWVTDAQVVDEITEIAAGIEMLEVADSAPIHENGMNHRPPPTERMDDEIEGFLQELSRELGVEG
jgi:anti-sigma factor RsiW